MASPYLPANQGATLGLAPGGQADLVTITTPNGAKFTVARKVAPQFQGFVNELSSSGYGIDPKSSGGYNDRTIAGTGTKSQHAYGNAVDINWNANPRGGASDLPPNVGDIAAKYGLAWGGNWKNPDPMHFEASTLVGAPTDGADANMTPGEMLLKRAIQKNSPVIGTPAATTGAVPTAVTPDSAGMARLKAALGMSYDPTALKKAQALTATGQDIAGTSGNALGAIGGSILAGIGGYQSSEQEDKKKAFDEQLRQGLANGTDTKSMARLLMASPDPQQQAMGVELFSQAENAKFKNPEKFGTTPQYYKDPTTGDLKFGVLSDKGSFKPMTAPGQILPPTYAVDTATGTQVTARPGGVPMSNVPKDVKGAAQQGAEGKNVAERVNAQPQTNASVRDSLANLDRLAAKATALKTDKGLAGATGVFDGRSWVPTFRQSTADAEAALHSLKSEIGFDTLQAMRAASKTGGALGSVSDSEGARLENSLTSLDPLQGTDTFKTNLDNVIQYAKDAKQRILQSYKDTYGGDFDPTITVAPAAGDTTTPPPAGDQSGAAPSGYKVLKVH